MIPFKTLLQFSISLLTACSCLAFTPALGDSNFYEQGALQRDQGNWQDALDIWASVLDASDGRRAPDPRIGFSFIELVTEKEAVTLYEKASDLYFWGLAGTDFSPHSVDIKKEVQRISPILTRDQRSTWLKLFEKNDKELLKSIREFWIRKDPILTTEVNERLVEHWRRIAVARSKFNKDSTSVYQTDDRGIVFVKYGAPESSYSGKLGLDQFEIMRWLDDFLLRQEIQRFNQMPEFEIWIYEHLEKGSTTTFLFGKKSGYGKYGLRYGIEEFIPDRGFRRGSTHTTSGILPGFLLQLMYYRELIDVDDFYLERYRELEGRWINARAAGDLSPNSDVLRGLRAHYKSLDLKNAKFESFEPDRTNSFEALEKLYLNYKIFRYLDDNRQPRLNVTVVSSDEPIDKNFSERFFKPAKKSKFKHRHVLIVYDENQRMLDRMVDYPDVTNYNTSVFSVAHNSSYMYGVTAEKVILDVRKAELQESDLPDTAKVIGVQSALLEAEPLVAGSEIFEVSDTIVGTDALPDLADSGVYPFKTMPVDPVKSSSVQIYWQFYNLKLNSKGKGKLRVEYQLQAIKKKGKVDKKTEFLKRTFEHEFATSDGDYLFTLDISRLKPARYELTLKVTDRQAKTKRVRKSRFRIAG